MYCCRGKSVVAKTRVAEGAKAVLRAVVLLLIPVLLCAVRAAALLQHAAVQRQHVAGLLLRAAYLAEGQPLGETGKSGELGSALGVEPDDVRA